MIKNPSILSLTPNYTSCVECLSRSTSIGNQLGTSFFSCDLSPGQKNFTRCEKSLTPKKTPKKRHKKAKLFFFLPDQKRHTQKLKPGGCSNCNPDDRAALFTPPCGETPCVAMAVFRIQPPPTGTLSLGQEVANMLRVILREFPLPKNRA